VGLFQFTASPTLSTPLNRVAHGQALGVLIFELSVLLLGRLSMSYVHLDYQALQDPRLRGVFHHADMYLFDVYGMFRRLPPEDRGGGGANFSIVLVLLCIVDGLATEVWPGRDQEKEQQKRFKRLIRDSLPWGPEGKGKWLDKGNAADQLYAEFRNPLVHHLARDRLVGSPALGHGERVVGRWGSVPANMRDIAKIEALPSWDDAWPILREREDEKGLLQYKLTAAGLYWAVKQLAKDMAAGKAGYKHLAESATAAAAADLPS
jgi:hypothetical protein